MAGLPYEFDVSSLPAWKEAIGDFMVSFNECERYVHMYVELLVRPNLAALLQGERLKKRTDIAQAAIKDAGLSIPESRVREIFKRLSKLAEFRNLLAHNAPQITVFVMEDGDMRGEMELQSHKGDSTSIGQIRNRAVEAREVAGEMLSLCRDIFNEVNPIPGLDG